MTAFADQLRGVCKPYLGIATDDFLRRTARTLMGKELEQLTADDHASVVYWLRIGAKDLLREKQLDLLMKEIEGISP